MPTCPAGHLSSADSHCDVCGLLIATPPIGLRADAPADVPDEPCPECSAERVGRFCEDCGHDFTAVAQTEASPLRQWADPLTHAAPHIGASEDHARGDGPGVLPATWWAIVAADPAYYQAMADRGVLDTGTIAFPAHAPQQRVPLNKARIRIGRRSVSRGIYPEIDLAGPPADPAVSHAHATLLARPGGAWALVDDGSTNGTTVNGTDHRVARNTEVELHEADRIYVGAWTVIVLHRQRG